MLQSTNFTFNGVNSEDKGVVLVNLNSGLFQDIFLANRTLIESKVAYSNYDILKRVDKSLPTLSLTFYVERWRTWNNIRDIARWLDVDEYCEFWTDDDPERIYYLTLVDGSQLHHNGFKDGYITLNFKSMFPYALSPEYNYSYITNHTSPIQLNLDNAGDEDVKPFIKIKKIGNGDITIRNLRNEEDLIITDLFDGEEVEIDNEHEILRSSLEESNNRYIFGNHNGVWLTFNKQNEPTDNDYSEFQFIGDYEFEFKFRLVYKNETR